MAASPPNPPPPAFPAGSSSPKPPPPPFPGHLSDGELIDSYLRPRVDSSTKVGFIHEADLYSADPFQLTKNRPPVTARSGQSAWYFFTPLHPKGSTKTQMKRNVDTGRKGTWVGVGRPTDVFSNGQRIGKRRGFAFQKKVGGNLVDSAWHMIELRLNSSAGSLNPNEGGQEAGSSGLLALCKVYRILNAELEEWEDDSSMVVAKADAEAPASSAAATSGREGADEEIGADTAAGPALKKRKAGDKDSGAETVAPLTGRQKKADGEIESADAAEEAEQEEPRDPRDPPFYDSSDLQNPKKE